jgi:conjugative relaxase-like TrwC/TraI family protein
LTLKALKGKTCFRKPLSTPRIRLQVFEINFLNNLNFSVMLRITMLNSPARAKSYHKSSLSKQGEYYGEEVDAFYHGKLSELLGVSKVSTENFGKLVDGIHPNSSERLTIDTSNRRIGWDLTILPPKSFSLAKTFSNDSAELERAFRDSNRLMMLKAQELILVQNNTSTERRFESTSSGIWAEFHHQVGRPVAHQYKNEEIFAGQPLEHLHNVLFSLSHSKTKDRFLAVEPLRLYKSAPFLESYFHNMLSNKLAELGYVIERTDDNWTIKGISKSVLDRFSERGKIVEKIAKEKAITDPKARSEIAARSRVSKNKSVPENQLYDVWKAQLSKEELSAFQSLKSQEKSQQRTLSVREAIDRSLEHFLERNSVAETDRILGHAMSLSYGTGHSLQDFENDLAGRDNILYGSDGVTPILSTKEMVKSEDQMISKAINGFSKNKPIHPNYKIKRDFLNNDQTRAVKSILSSSDRIINIEGNAGTGKSTLLQELSDGVNEKGLKVIPIAPSSQAVEVLRKEGFKDAQTIASFLVNTKSQNSITGNVLVVDESSMCGVKTMNKILSIAEEKKARQVVLSGNIRQHSSPGEHGDALRILQQRAQIKTIHVKENMRQKPELYKQAVNLIANKKIIQGYKVLDEKLKAVQEIPDKEDRFDRITDDYIQSIKSKRSAIIISPTNFEKDAISDLTREKLKAEGIIKQEERVFETLKDLSLTQSQKRDGLQYQPGRVVRMIKNQVGGLRAGSHLEVISNAPNQPVRVKDLKTGSEHNLPLDKPEYFNVYTKTKTPISVGEFVKPTANLVSKEGSKINNGTPQRVKAFVKDDILLENGKTLSKDSYHLAHNYTSTSHAAQSRTCHDLYISMSDMSMGAINDQTFYTAVSRGRSKIQIYTNDKAELKSAITRSGERTTAHDVAKQHHYRLIQRQQQLDYKKRIKNERDYAAPKQRRTTATRDISQGVERR